MGETTCVPAKTCFHCDLPVPPGSAPRATLGGVDRVFCCMGCRAVAELIYHGGHGAYYARRDAPGMTAVAGAPDRVDGVQRAPRAADADVLADDAQIQRTFARDVPSGRAAVFALDGARCAACAWLIERHLGEREGVVDVQVNVATARMRVVWQPELIPASAILRGLREIGYSARPHRPDQDEARQREERRASLRRLGIAGLGTMQVMMFAVGLYAGDATGIDAAHRDLLRWASWAVATVVVGLAGWPFFAGAVADLRRRAPGMDVPVALAIGAAYAASALATVTGTGQVYFESACMFTFFLGLTRHLEMSARHARDARIRKRLGRLPEVALRVGPDGAVERVPATSLRPGDRVRLEPGDLVPADGVLVEGRGAADESLLTGEAAPRGKRPGDRVVGGSHWLEAAAVVRVERVGAQSTAARIAALLERAQLDRPPAERMADRIAARFVTGVVLASVGVYAAWRIVSPDDALWVTLSVLVATCPCALSLATPAALASASAGLAERGFLICRGRVLETLNRVTHVVFDKTGTLTWPELRLTHVRADGPWSRAEVLGLARALERHSDHPVARALRGPDVAPDVARAESALAARLSDVSVRPGAGIEARLNGERVRIGHPGWACVPGARPPRARALHRDESWVALAVGDGVVGWLAVGGAPRPGASEVVAALRGRGIGVSLASGDPSHGAVERLATRVGIDAWSAGSGPEDKLRHVVDLQSAGRVVAVVGDGLNDAPVLGRADIGIALGSGADLARVSADAVVLGDRLSTLEEAWDHAARTRRVMRQNLTWAVAYNLSVLPLAAAGAIAPWMAALGMSASSLLVVGNSLRLRRVASRHRAPASSPDAADVAEPAARAAWASS